MATSIVWSSLHWLKGHSVNIIAGIWNKGLFDTFLCWTSPLNVFVPIEVACRACSEPLWGSDCFCILCVQQELSSCDRHWDNHCSLEAVPAACLVLTYHVMGYIGWHKSFCLYTETQVCVFVSKGDITDSDFRKMPLHNNNNINVQFHNYWITTDVIWPSHLLCCWLCLLHTKCCQGLINKSA